MAPIQPAGKVKDPYKAPSHITLTADQLSDLPLDKAIIHLRDFPTRDGETFPWILVERFVKKAETDDTNPLSDVLDGTKPTETPQDGYQWYWVDNMARLSGMGGWLEVDVVNKRQGRFKFMCMS